MIVYDLACQAGDHRFEGWFGSSDDFDAQRARGLVTCPVCGSEEVVKAVMAPHVGRKGNQLPAVTAPAAPGRAVKPQPMATTPMPHEAVAMLRAVAAMQAEVLKQSTWVGDRFADDARAMHYGEKDAAPIHGQATPDEARALVEEGIEIAPVLFPLAAPGETN